MKCTFSASVLLAALLASTVNAGVLVPRQDTSSVTDVASTVSSAVETGASTVSSAVESGTSSASSAVDSTASSASSSESTSSTASSTSTSIPLISASAQPSASDVPTLVPYGAANLSSYENSTAVGSNGLSNANCTVFQIDVPVNAENFNFTNVRQNYRNQSYITGQILRFANFQEAYQAEHINGTFINNNTYSINATYCTPIQGRNESSSLITAIHGIGFNSQYWDFGYAPEYSLVNQATSAGYDILIYDRLGTGGSSVTTNGFDEPQAATEVSIYASILTKLRDGTFINGTSFDRIVGVGHSYGSVQIQAVTALAPELLDGAVLTGYSNSTDSIIQFLLGSGFEPASRVLPAKFSSKPNVWLAAGSNASIVQNFFWPPNYAQGAFDVAYAGSDVVTLAGLFTLGAVGGTAEDFTGPVFVLTGERDLPFCASDCTTGGKLEGVQALYPQTSNFTTKLVPETGHGLSPHYTGPQSQRDIVEFFISNGL